MIGDDDALQRAIRSQVDEDVAAFVASLDSDVGTGVPPPPNIKVTEVSTKPYEFVVLEPTEEQARTEPSTAHGEGPPPPSPCCPPATLVCDAISADLCKCGFSEFGTPSDPAKYYLTKTTDTTANASYDASAGCPPAVSTSDWSSTRTDEYDPDTCEQSCASCSGDGGNFNVNFYTGGCVLLNDSGATTVGGCDTGGFCTIFSEIGYGTISGCGVEGSSRPEAQGCFGGCSGTTTIDSTTSETTSYACDFSSITFFHGTVNVSLSDEYTTALLIDNTELALPDYSDCFGCDAETCLPYQDGESCDCTSSRHLSDDESCYSIRRFKYKFTFADPLEEECTLCWIERTYDEDGNTVSDSQRCETVLVGETETTVYEVMEPSENGSIGIVYPTGPCCIDGACSTLDEATCESMGGDYLGDCCDDGEDACCDPNPCPPP